MVDWQVVLAGLLGIVPAFGILVLAYGRYDGKFRDETMFLLFMAGLFAGFPVGLVEAWLFYALVVLLGFPLFEQLLKTVVLNLRRYQGQATMRFYGGSFGLGLGTILVFVPAALLLRQRGLYADLGGVVADPIPLLALLAMGVGTLLMHFATGIVIGEGVAVGKPFRGAAFAIAAALPHQVLWYEFFAGARDPAGGVSLLWPAVALAYGLVLTRHVLRNVLPNALPPGERRKLKKLFAGWKTGEPG
ncbi:MAG TPA: hypothetical protein VM681_08730 [Candidatus Thermoplasmatota archaeon]|nr:hypothetical protein [Candidatus Thermoplasmatota archaeon]